MPCPHDHAVTLDLAHVTRALVLHESMQRWSEPDAFVLWMLCLDPESAELLREMELPGVRVVEEHDIADPDLVPLRATRSQREYAFATKPFLIEHVLRTACAARVTLLDVDLMFQVDPALLLDATEGASVTLSMNHYLDPTATKRFGTYNAGWLSFARGAAGTDALGWWRDRCIEATPDYPIDGRYGEQRYLDDLAARVPGVTVLSHRGANVASWNLRRNAVVDLDRDGATTIDGVPVVFFHAHGLDRWTRTTFGVPSRTSRDALDALFRPYVDAMLRWETVVESRLGRRLPLPAPWGSSRPRPWWWRTVRVTTRRLGSAATASVVRAR